MADADASNVLFDLELERVGVKLMTNYHSTVGLRLSCSILDL